MIDSPCWTITFSRCQRILVHHIVIDNSLIVSNSDGIHLSACKDAVISDSIFSCGDDCIAVTCITAEGEQDISERILIHHCHMRSRSAAVRLGHEQGKIRDVLISDLVITDSNRGFAIFSRTGGFVENVRIHDVILHTRIVAGAWWGKGEAVVICAAGSEGRIRNIDIRNLSARCEGGILLAGSEGNVENITLKDISLAVKEGPNYGAVWRRSGLEAQSLYPRRSGSRLPGLCKRGRGTGSRKHNHDNGLRLSGRTDGRRTYADGKEYGETMRVKVKLRQAVIGKTLCIAAAALLLSACSTPDRTPVVLEGEPVTNGYVEDLPPAAAEGAYRADSADVAILSQMTKMMENAHIEFYLGEYYDIAVLDKDTGCVYFSNKAIYDEELSDQMMPEGMDETYSQITLEYFDGADQVFTLASYPDSVEEDKVNIAGETDSVTVTYTFGVKDLDKTICTAFTVEDFNKINELANQKIEEGTLGLVDYRRFYNSYIHIDIDKYNSAELQLYLDQYPALKTWGELYVLQIPPTDITKSIVSEVSPILGIDSAYIQQSMEKIGMEKNAISNSMYFEIPIVYRLDERDLLVSLDTSRIVSQDGFKLTQVNLFNDFAASLGSDNGYVFIPEGSGSIVENTAVTTGQATLDIPFYGSDFCVDHKTSDTVAPYASLPVFGATEEGRGYLAIVESGAANGGVTARVQDSVVPYSTVGPWVTYYSQDVNADGNYIYKKSPAKTEFKVRYHFLYGEDSTYSGMARYYQKYLLQTGLLKKSSERSGLPLNLNFVCGIDKDQVVFGVPVKKVFAAFHHGGHSGFCRPAGGGRRWDGNRLYAHRRDKRRNGS